MGLRLEPKVKAPGFIRVALPEPDREVPASHWEIETPGGVKLRVPAGIGLAQLAGLVQLLERR